MADKAPTKVDTSIYEGLGDRSKHNALVRDLLDLMDKRAPPADAAPPAASAPASVPKASPARAGRGRGRDVPVDDGVSVEAGTLPDPTNVADARAYLIKTATPGDTMQRQGAELAIGRLHPTFAVRLATAVKAARAMGIPVGVTSAYRPPIYNIGGFGGGVKGKFRSLHSYGLAVDVTGLDGPGGKNSRQWYKIATAAGLFNPYGPRNWSEYNHYQAVPEKVASEALKATITAKGPINLDKMWKVAGVTPNPDIPGTVLAYADPSADAGGSEPRSLRSDDPLGVKGGSTTEAGFDPRYPPRGFRKNDASPDIEPFQSMLQDLGYYGGKVDGKYGNVTRDAVKKFQKDNGLTEDGVIGVGPKSETGPALFRSWSSRKGMDGALSPGAETVEAGAGVSVPSTVSPELASVEVNAGIPAPLTAKTTPVQEFAAGAGVKVPNPTHAEERGYDPADMLIASAYRRIDAEARKSAEEYARPTEDLTKKFDPHPEAVVAKSGPVNPELPSSRNAPSKARDMSNATPVEPARPFTNAELTADFLRDPGGLHPEESPLIPVIKKDMTRRAVEAKAAERAAAGVRNPELPSSRKTYDDPTYVGPEGKRPPAVDPSRVDDGLMRPAPIMPKIPPDVRSEAERPGVRVADASKTIPKDAFDAFFGPEATTIAPKASEPTDDAFSAFFGTGPAAPTDINPETGLSHEFDPMAPKGRPVAPPPGGGPDTGVISRSLVKGLPVVGPALDWAGEHSSAWLRSVVKGTKFEDELAAAKAAHAQAEKDNPNSAAFGEGTGQVLGYTGAVAAAPAAFGLDAAMPLASRTGASMLTNTALSGADAAARGEDPLTAAMVGGTLGMFVPGVGGAVGRLLSSGVRKDIAALAEKAINKFGIALDAAQLSSNPLLKFAHGVVEGLPLTGGTAAKASRQEAFNRAVARTFGEDADHVSHSVIKDAYERIGKDFDDVLARIPDLPADAPLANGLIGILNELPQTLKSEQAAPIKKQLDSLIAMIQSNGNKISGEAFQNLTKYKSPLDKLMDSSDSSVANYAHDIRDLLDSWVERYAPADVLDKWKTAKSQYKALKTVGDIASKNPVGDVSPALLMTPVRQKYPDFIKGGGGDLGDLARIGQAFMKEPPSSGTSERSLMYSTLGSIGKLLEPLAAGGGAALASGGHIPLSLAAAGAPIAVGRAARKIVSNKALVNHLIDSSLNGPGKFARRAPYAVPVAAQFLRGPLTKVIEDARRDERR